MNITELIQGPERVGAPAPLKNARSNLTGDGRAAELFGGYAAGHRRPNL
jgi:hypothetical protein